MLAYKFTSQFLISISLFQICTYSGATFDLKPLTVTDSTSADYHIIKSGDIPCTPEVEELYSYTWNFCSAVLPSALPDKACSLKGKTGVALQSTYTGDNDFNCFVIGSYEPAQDNSYYSLLGKTF